MSVDKTTEPKGPRQLKIHTQYLVAITRLAKPMGWAISDPINLSQTRSGKITIENLADPHAIAARAQTYADVLEEKERIYKAKKEKKAAEAIAVKEEKERVAAAKAEETKEAEVSSESDVELKPEPNTEA